MAYDFDLYVVAPVPAVFVRRALPQASVPRWLLRKAAIWAAPV